MDFRDGSTLTEADLDLAVTQLLYIAQEAYDALDGETAVAAKDKAEKILKEVEEVFAKTQIEINYFRKMWIDVQESPTAPGRGEYDFTSGKMTLYVPAGPVGPQGPWDGRATRSSPAPQGEQGPRCHTGAAGHPRRTSPEGQQGTDGSARHPRAKRGDWRARPPRSAKASKGQLALKGLGAKPDL